MTDTFDTKPFSRLDLPYKNLILTGFVGVGKSTIGQAITNHLGVDYLDIDEEIELRELMSIAKIRELYGDSRLRSLEHDLCRQAALMRRGVVVAPGAALLDARNYDLLSESGQIVCVTCELGEALHRMHLKSEQHYRDVTIRRRMLSRMRRERAVVEDTRILQLDTTHLSVEESVDLLVQLWFAGESDSPLFRYGPAPSIKPLPRPPVGLSARTQVTAKKH
jgi:shikimate kinase